MRIEALETYIGKLDEVIGQYNDILSASKTPTIIIDRIIDADGKGIEFDLKNELYLGEGNIFGLRVSETDTQKLMMAVLRNPVLLNEGVSTYLPRIMFLMMPNRCSCLSTVER